MSWLNSADAVNKAGMIVTGLIIVFGIVGFSLRIQEARLKKQSDKEKASLRSQLDDESRQKSEWALRAATELFTGPRNSATSGPSASEECWC